MPWWGWIILGVLLLGSELLGVDAAFYLVFVGVSAVIVGLVGLTGLQLETWVQWLLFAGLALSSMVFFRKRLYQQLRGVTADYAAGPQGESLKLTETLEPGDSCRMDYRGTTWDVFNASDEILKKDALVKIEKVTGLKLMVGPKETAP